jgi:hypothetical protein
MAFVMALVFQSLVYILCGLLVVTIVGGGIGLVCGAAFLTIRYAENKKYWPLAVWCLAILWLVGYAVTH